MQPMDLSTLKVIAEVGSLMVNAIFFLWVLPRMIRDNTAAVQQARNEANIARASDSAHFDLWVKSLGDTIKAVSADMKSFCSLQHRDFQRPSDPPPRTD